MRLTTHQRPEREITMSTTTSWVVDPAHSTAEFRVPHFWGLVKVKGHFDRIGGWLDRQRQT
jgi:polyisoprenoid-binding protein YceI